MVVSHFWRWSGGAQKRLRHAACARALGVAPKGKRLSGRPPCKGVAIEVARRRAHRSGELALRIPPSCSDPASHAGAGGEPCVLSTPRFFFTAIHGTRPVVFFGGYGYVTTQQDGTPRSEPLDLHRLEIERSAHGHCSAPSHPFRALGLLAYRVSHGASFLAPGSFARRGLARVMHQHQLGLLA